jgi:AraC family transcriptional regulator
MQQLEIMNDAFAYIENHLSENIKTEDVAAACYCSKTSLEKIFRSQQNCSVHGYITRRRMTLAGQELRLHPERRIIDIALDFGYTSNEAFTRAFFQVWNCTPSEFRKKDGDPGEPPGPIEEQGTTDGEKKDSGE